jgi:hypothetical protein
MNGDAFLIIITSAPTLKGPRKLAPDVVRGSQYMFKSLTGIILFTDKKYHSAIAKIIQK